MDFGWISVVFFVLINFMFTSKKSDFERNYASTPLFYVICICESWMQKYEMMFDYENQI